MFSRRKLLIGGTVMLAGGLALAAGLARTGHSADAEKPVHEVLTQVRADFNRVDASRADDLATWCDQQPLPEQAAEARSWLLPRKADRQYLFIPADYRQLPLSEKPRVVTVDYIGTSIARFHERFRSLKRERATELLSLAETAVAEHQASTAYQLVSEAAREDATCTRAWQMLGYTQYRDAWRTPFEIQQLKAGKVWHESFGWLPATHVARYEQGERFFQGRWMPAEEEAARRAELKEDWRIETDHYVVTTNCGLAEGVALADRLERLRALWQQVFTGYLVEEDQFAKRLAAGEPLTPPAAAKHNVVYFRTRQQYNDELRALQPQIEMTLGIYLASRRTAYFFAGDQQEPGTLDHEATHQLFHESRPVAKDVGAHDNFWIVEAVACYMQSLVRHDGYYTLGGAEAGRLPIARQRRLHDGVYLPLAKLVRLGMRDLQEHVDIARLYTESAGLAAFLIERYPEPTAGYLKAVYSGRADVNTLSQLTGVEYPQLDREYAQFLEALGP